MLLPLILRYRLDFVAFLLLTLLATFAARRIMLRRQPNARCSVTCTALIGLLILVGGLTAEWAGEQRRGALVSLFSGLGSTFAYEFQQLGHARVDLTTPPDDPAYLSLIERQKAWLRINPQMADIYTFRYDAEGNVRFIVDSETDYDHDGVIQGEREERTRIGEVFPEATPEFHRVLKGEPCFDTTFEPDRWGVWVASLSPIYDASGRVEAAIGIDYPGAEWLSRILAYRALTLGSVGVLVAIVLASITIGRLMRAEIHERKAAQEQLRKDKDAADLVSRAKSEFISMMSHEIRSPLTALTGYASLLTETPLNAAQQRFAGTITAMADRLNTIVGDVYDLIKLQEGNLTIESLPFFPAALINEVSDPMTARAMEKGLALRVQADLPAKLSLMGDAARLRQVLVGLLNNALKFTDEGSVRLEAKWIRDHRESAAGQLILSVGDTGIGMAAGRLNRLFTKSAEAKPAHGHHRGTRGIGLVVCQQLVRLMKGRIEGQRAPGHGTLFTVTIPCAIADDAGAPAEAAAISAPAARRVLVVDHSIVNGTVIQSVLTRNGYEVVLARGANPALQALASNPIVAILIDVGSAETASMAAVRQLRAAGSAGEHVPIIAFADQVDRDTRAACLALGIDECLSKPPYMPAVTAALTALLHSSVSPG